MSFLPDILAPTILDQMALRAMTELSLDKTDAQQGLAETLGFSNWATLQSQAEQGVSQREVIANPQARPETAWFSLQENRQLVWSMLNMSMRAGIDVLEALVDIKETLVVAGYGKDMEATIDFLTTEIFKSPRSLVDVFTEAVSPYDKDEAARLVILARLGSFLETISLLAGSPSGASR